MALNTDSPLVCQIPGCTTTQTEIEAELVSFLASFCSVCKKERNGQLCSCAFPCSLTFKSQMLLKIHELLGIAKPPDRRAIQVCFKHPDLLKQAREACVVKRDEANKLKRKSLDSKTSNPKPAKITKDQNQPKMCKIQFQDNESSSEEEFADPSTISTCSRVLPISSKSVKIKFRLDSDTENESEEIEDDDLQRKLCEIFGNPEVEEDSQSSSASSSNFIIEKSPTRKVMKIHYQDYYKRILTSEMKSLMHQSYLNDVEFVCKDGSIFCNSLILGSMSNYLYNILADVPIVDKVKIVIMPDISSVDLNALFKCLFNNEIRQISVKDMKRIKSIASLFKLESIFDISRKPGRPKGSLNKPKIVTKSSSVEQPLIESQPRKVQFTSDHSEDSLRESVDSECLEILSATSSNQPQNTSQLMTHHHNQNQEKMNLLPSNDLLDQIVQDTTRTNNSGNT